MLDTNIWISALVFSSSDMIHVIDAAATRNELVVSSVGKRELFDVVDRKFPSKRQAVERLFLASPHTLVEVSAVSSSDAFLIRDANDYPILNSAIACGVDAFVSGDKDFWEVDIEHPKILKPWELLSGTQSTGLP
jgi:putative PIN family toxin of toxin-antitoxin system